MERILIGISGGIDSAAATLLLQQQGFQVTALWIDMLGCAVQKRRVEELCRLLNVPLVVENVQQKFKEKVVNHTLNEHQAGRTPSPCAMCNVMVKWATLCQVADRLQITKIATGHYVQIVKENNTYYVARGADPIKDQSYYLYALDQATLSRAITPLGQMRKVDVRNFLALKGFKELAAGGESQGLCFVESGYNNFLRQNLAPIPGEVITANNEIVGTHDGFQLYTIGQKRGFLASMGGEVRKIDASQNKIIIGEPLTTSTIVCYNAIFNPLPPSPSSPITVAVRGLGRNPKGAAEVSIEGNVLTIFLLEDTAWAVTPGQPVVLYSNDLVVGGGIAAENFDA